MDRIGLIDKKPLFPVSSVYQIKFCRFNTYTWNCIFYIFSTPRTAQIFAKNKVYYLCSFSKCAAQAHNVVTIHTVCPSHKSRILDRDISGWAPHRLLKLKMAHHILNFLQFNLKWPIHISTDNEFDQIWSVFLWNTRNHLYGEYSGWLFCIFKKCMEPYQVVWIYGYDVQLLRIYCPP